MRKTIRLMSLCIICITLLFTVMLSGVGCARAPKTFRGDIVDGAVGSSGYVAAGAIARVVSKYNNDILLTATTGPAGHGRLRMLAEGSVAIAYAGIIDARRAYLNEEPFDKEPIPTNLLPYKALSFSGAPTFIITKKERNDIKTVDDLIGKKLSATTGTTFEITRLMHGPEGINIWDKIKHEKIEFDDISDALFTGRIDATVAYLSDFGQSAAPWLMQVLSRQKVKFVPYTEEQAKKLNQVRGSGIYYMSTKYFRDQGQDIPEDKVPSWLQMNSFLVSPAMEKDVAYRITKTVCEHGAELAEVAGGGGLSSYANKEEMATSIKVYLESMFDLVPVHPGVAKYYQEIGVWDNKYKAGK